VAAKEKSVKVAITSLNKEEGDMLAHVARACGFEKIQIFLNPRETLEVAKRNQFDLFITHHDFPDMTGLTMIQTLRSTGNYGIEPHLFLVDVLTPDIMHVLTKPFSTDRTHQKLAHLWQGEVNMSPTEQQYREAHAAMNSGLMEMAQELAIKNLRTHGPSEKLLLLLGDVETKLNHPVEARRYYDAAQRLNPKSSAAAQKLAQTYMLEKDFTKAAELMNELTRLNPLNIELLANAGLSNFESGNMDKAKDVMNRLQSLDKERKDASEVLAKVAIHEGDYDTAMKQLRGTHDQKELVQMLNNEGVRLSQLNDVTAAINMYQKCINIIGNEHPYVYALHYNMGLAYHKLHDKDNAVISLRKALELKPDFEKAASALSRLEARSA
jgi:tetratricopeptide (TPR) repeat protein